MAKKQTKRQFDWREYAKPPRALSETQEEAFSGGMLAPVIERARQTPGLAFEIRARAASLYYRGVSLGRINGEGPFVAELDAIGTPDGPGPHLPADRWTLDGADHVTALLGRFEEAYSAIDAAWDATDRAERDYLQQIAAANPSGDLFGNEYVVVDLEYTYGKRRYDLVALRRTEGVTGPGGFANPRLVLVDVRCPGQSLTGQNGLDAVAGDVAELVKATGSEHLQRIRTETAELAAQKVRLGLLPADLEVRAVDVGTPELLALFIDYAGIESSSHDAAIIALHDRLNARHFPTDRLRFAVLEGAASATSGPLELDEDAPMTYRAFKEWRAQRRG